MNRLGIAFPLALLGMALFLVGCGGGGGGGGGVTNPGTGPSFDLHFPATNASQTFVFNDAGTWDYHCTPHGSQGMTGSVVVNASSANDSMLVSVGPSNTLTFSPASVTIKPGGVVRWVNVSTMTIHTVTRP